MSQDCRKIVANFLLKTRVYFILLKLHAFAKKHKQDGKSMSKHIFIKNTGNVFKDLSFDDVDAKKLNCRSHLMSLLVHYIQQEGLTQKEAA